MRLKIGVPFLFVRHGESIGNVMSADERAECSMPNWAFPLTERGMLQAKYVAEYLKEYCKGNQYHFDGIFCSTFARASQTAQITLETLGSQDSVHSCMDARLNEKWDGIIHELPREVIKEKYLELLISSEKINYYHYRAPGGESCPDVELRIRDFARDYLPSVPTSKDSDRPLLIFGHGRWWTIFEKLLRGLSVEEFMVLKASDSCENGSIMKYDPRATGEKIEVIVPWKGKIADNKGECA